MKYAKNVLAATLLNAVHRAGLLYHRRFDLQLTKYEALRFQAPGPE
jgi:hypothetical protein